MRDLRPLAPADAKEMYLADREGDVRDATLEAHHYRLKAFVEWCAENAIDDLRDLSGRDLFAFKSDRADDLAQTSLQGQLSTLRVFLRFAADVDAVEPQLAEKVRPPTPEDDTRERRVERDDADAILNHLRRYEYASRDHALMLTAWHTAARIGGLRALDVDDVALDDPEQPHLRFRHRRDTGEPLKNGTDGNRDVAIAPHVVDVLRDYIDERREDVEDDHGRRPLFTTTQGRLSEGWLRQTVYALTRPCETGECPHDRDPESCDAATVRDRVSTCPSTRSPHDVRRGSISDHLARGWPIEELSERVNATPKVIRKHYDVRRARESMLTRSELLDTMSPPPHPPRPPVTTDEDESETAEGALEKRVGQCGFEPQASTLSEWRST